MNNEKKNARLAELEKMQTEVANSNKGRKTLVESGKEERIPFTTSITRTNRERLGIYAIKNRLKMSDVLDEILTGFFQDKNL